MRMSSDRVLSVTRTWVGIAVAVGIGVQIGYWFTRAFEGDIAAPPPRVATEAVATEDPLGRLMLTTALFGSRPPDGPPRNIAVLGLVSDANGLGGAIVAVEGRAPRAVKVGDRIEGRRVTEISRTGITFDGGGANNVVPLTVTAPSSTEGLDLAPTGSPRALPATQYNDAGEPTLQ